MTLPPPHPPPAPLYLARPRLPSAHQPWVPWDGHEEGRFPGVFLARVEAALPKDDEWAEVMHVRRREEHRLRQDIASEGQFWYWLAPGSGIWLHVGKAMRVRTAGVYSPGCERAVEQGYDTILLSPSRAGVPPGFTRYGGAVEIVDCRGDPSEPPARQTFCTRP